MLNKKYVVLVVIFLVFTGAYAWYQSKENETNTLQRYIEFSTVHYEASLRNHAIDEIPDLLQKEKIVKNCTEIKRVSSGQKASGSTCEISAEFEFPSNLGTSTDDNIVETVKSFIGGINPGFTSDLNLKKIIHVDIKRDGKSPVLQINCSFSIGEK